MKHVFVVHSNITYLVSIGIIEKEKINQKDVLIISDGYTCRGPLPITVVNVSACRGVLISSIRKYIQLYFDPRHELYKILNDFIKEDVFIAYVPVLHLIKKLVILHPKCQQFHFIEEGTASYYTKNTLDDYAFIHGKNNWFYPKGIKGLKQRIHTAFKEFGFKTGVIESIPIYYMNFDSESRFFYGLSDLSHPALFLGKKKVIELSSLIDLYEWNLNIMELANVNIWIGDPDVQNWYGKESFCCCIKNILIPAIKDSVLYVRFHYRESEEQRNFFLSILNQYSIKYEIIDDEQIMELIFVKSHNCKCYGFQSSLLMYAKILGLQSYSIAKGIPEMKKNSDNLIPSYSKFVKYI